MFLHQFRQVFDITSDGSHATSTEEFADFPVAEQRMWYVGDQDGPGVRLGLVLLAAQMMRSQPADCTVIM